MNIRVEMINGDSRQGRYMRHDPTHLVIHDGLQRKIPLTMIADVSTPGVFESCLDTSSDES
jgi:hypothetical protein